MEELKVFNNVEFGSIRMIEIDSEPYFLGTDVAAALQYSDKNKAVQMHVEDEDKKTLSYKASDKSSEALWSKINDFSDKVVINESGLYSMILSSQLPSAKKFKHWITSEVLPQIHKTGGYRLPQTYADALRELADKAEQNEKLLIENEEMRRTVIPYIESLKFTEQQQMIIQIIESAVRAAEQVIKEQGQGKTKKSQVLAYVAHVLTEKGIHITEEEMDKLIESAVYCMKQEKASP